jgi:hypothetical protein
MKKIPAATLACLAVLVLAAPGALAGQVIYSGTHGYERIGKGVFDLGIDNMLLVSYMKTTAPPVTAGGEAPEFSSLSASYMVGLTPRYYLIDNLSMALNLNFFYGKATTTTTLGGVDETDTSTDLGFLGFVMFNYNVRLGNSFFFKPGIGAGGFYGARQYPTDVPGLKRESKLYGGAGRIDLGFQFYAGPHFNLKAGPDIILRFGQEKPTDTDGQSFMSVEAAFNIGIGYSF